jgi:hypothetical protein
VVVEDLADHRGHVEDLRPFDAGHRVEVDPQFVGMVEVAGPHGMRIEVDAAQVHRPDEAGGVVDHRLGRRGARGVAKFGHIDPVRALRRGALLEYGLAPDALDEPLEDHRPVRHATQCAPGHRQVVVDQIPLGDGGSLRGRGKHRLVRMGDGHAVAGHLKGCAFFRRSAHVANRRCVRHIGLPHVFGSARTGSGEGSATR